MSGVLNLLLAGAASAIKDAYFNLVTLLLNTSSTNGAQNNTFLDSSTNNFTITRNGNTTQGTFTPFSQTGWSNYFGSSNFLTVSGTSTACALPADFTIELWLYNASTTLYGSLISTVADVSTANGLRISTGNNNNFIEVGSALVGLLTSSTAFSNNAWVHIALVRSGTTLTLYQNGVSVASATNVQSFVSDTVYIGNLTGLGSPYYVNGYISNLRVVKGTAVYTSAFTPSTTPLTAITNTSLLTCQSNRFLDNSTNAFALTVNGTPSVQAFSPFLPTASYSTSTVGGSGFFVRANSDNLTLPLNSLLVGSSDFSLETWVYQFDRSGSMNFFGNQTDRTTAAGSSWNIAFTNSTGYIESTAWVGGTPYSLLTSVAPDLNAWNYIVWCRTGSTQSLFLNGIRVATSSAIGGGTVNNGSTNNPPAIGCNGGGAGDLLNGYMSGFKIIIGSGGYDATASTLTVPTAPPTNTTNTKLLANFTNAGIYDAAAKNDLVTVGNAQVSTTQAKWGTTSMYFDGSGDSIDIRPNNSLMFKFGTGDFTIETWVYKPSDAGYIFYGNTGNDIQFFINGSSQLVFAVGGVVTGPTSTSTVPNNTWTHVACTRSGTTTRIFINGVLEGSGTNSTNLVASNLYTIGASNFIGYLDDFRITLGYARYTASFTPPTAAFFLL